jgi:hypothetical protein
MNDNLIKKYKKKEKISKKFERFFDKTFKVAGIVLMGSILLRFAPGLPLTGLATTGIVASSAVILASVIGEFASSEFKNHFENKAYNLESAKPKEEISREKITRKNELTRTESYDNYRTSERDYGEYEMFTRNRPAVRQRMRKK